MHEPRGERYPAMCRDGHAEVRYGYDAEGLALREAETCPVCAVRAEAVRECIAALRTEEVALQFAHRVDDVLPQLTHRKDQEVARRLLALLASDLEREGLPPSPRGGNDAQAQ